MGLGRLAAALLALASSVWAHPVGLGGEEGAAVRVGTTLVSSACTLQFNDTTFAGTKSGSRCVLSFDSGTANQQAWLWNNALSQWEIVTFSTADFAVDFGTDSCTLDGSVTQLGSCIGEATDFCTDAFGGVDLGGTIVELPNGTAPTASQCDATGEAGRAYVETDKSLDPFVACPGASGWQSGAGRFWALGGTGADSGFQFDGSCSAGGLGGDCCRSGTITGTSPSKVCTLTANSILGRYQLEVSTAVYSCFYSFSAITISGGTVSCDVPPASTYAFNGAPTFGSVLWLRAPTISITGGTINMAGRGTMAGSGGNAGTAGNRAGGNGGCNHFFRTTTGNSYSLGGAAGDNPGLAGLQPPAAIPSWPTIPNFLPMGGGGAGGAGSNTAGNHGVVPENAFVFNWPFLGGTGGGGGGCSSSATSAAGIEGGRGGGGVILEAGMTYTCSGATITVAGNAAATGSAAAGAGGGGGGGIIRVARTFGTDTCTYTINGGAGSSDGQAACAPGAAGGDGRAWQLTAPF